MVIIKRYANRRLYDTALSSYITLEDVITRVKSAESFKVIDAKSGDDLTRRVLTQAVLEQARQGEAGPPEAFLRHLILASDPEMQDFLNWYLGQALDAFHRMKDDWQKGEASVQVLTPRVPTPPVPTPPKRSDSLADEMRELKRRMAEMEQRLSSD